MDFGLTNQSAATNAIYQQNYPYTDSNVTYDTYSGTDIVATILVPFEEEPLVLGELQTISYSIHRENTPVRTLGNVNPRGFVKGPRTIAGSLIFTQFNQYTFYRLKQYRQLMQQSLYGLADMLPPFDVILSFSNETGSFSRLKIYGVSIVDEGATMSVDDLMVEQTFTYMARGIQPLTSYIPSGVDKPTDTTYFSVDAAADVNIISFRA
jgi:hypothetical protein